MTEKVNIVVEVDSASGEARVRQLGQRMETTGRRGERAFRETGRSIDNMKGKLGAATKTMLKFGGAVAGVLAVRAAFRQLNAAISENIRLANEQEASEARRDAVLRASGASAWTSAEALNRMASEMQRVTTVGDEVTISAQAMLLSFKEIRGEGFERTMAAALDMSEVMQQDLRSSIVMLGKALNDPISNLGALSRAGVQLTDDQTEMVKALAESNRMLEAQDIILQELESQFGGAAEAAAGTFGGAQRQMKNAWGDLREELGFAITQNQFFIELMHILRDEFEKWGAQVEDNRGSLMALSKDGVMFFADAVIFSLHAVRALHNGFQGLKIAAHAVLAAVAGMLDTLHEGFRKLFAPLNLLYDGLRKLGLDLVNPFEEAAKFFNEFRASAEQGLGKVVDSAARTDQRYRRLISTIGGLRDRMSEVGTSAVEAGDAGQRAGENIADGMDDAAGSTLNASYAMQTMQDEAVKLYEELYEATGWQIYADKAIEAHRKILTENEKKWAKILGNEDEARLLREKREQEYVGSLMGLMDDVVKAESDTASERLRITEDLTRQRMELERQAAQSAMASSSSGAAGGSLRLGETTHSVTMATIRGQTYGPFANHAEAQRFADNLERTREAQIQTAEGISSLVDWSGRNEQRDIERLEREQRQQVESFWKSQQQLSETMFATATSIEDALAGLFGGAAAPAQSAEWYGARYQELYEAAFGDEERLHSLLSYVNDYLGFFAAYGGEYTAIFGSVVDDLERLRTHYETMGWLAQLGLGGTASEIDQLVSAFNSLGMTTEDLREAAILAAGQHGVEGLKGQLQGTETPFQNVQAALETFAGNAKLSVQNVAGFFGQLAESLGIAYSSGNVGTAVDKLTPTQPYEPPEKHWSSEFEMVPKATYIRWIHKDSQESYNAPKDGGYVPTYRNETWYVPKLSAYHDVAWENVQTGDTLSYLPPNARGGLARQMGTVAEIGPEWVVPTYEPQRSRFLRDVGADPDQIGQALARRLAPLLEAGGGGEIHVHLHVDGREMAHVLAEQYRQGHTDLIEQTRRAVH